MSDEVWLYSGGGNYAHGTPCLYRAEGTGRGDRYTSRIGLAIWPRDRFVSVDGPAEGGTLMTVPLVFDGTRLELNASTRPGGTIAVGLLDATGHTLARSRPIAGDSLRHVVRWSDDFALASLIGRPIVLKLDVTAASLFAFAFRGQ